MFNSLGELLQIPYGQGAAYNFQLLDDVPTAAHDVPADIAVTETEILAFSIL